MGMIVHRIDWQYFTLGISMQNAQKYEVNIPCWLPINLALLTTNLRFSLDVDTIQSLYYFSSQLIKGVWSSAVILIWLNIQESTFCEVSSFLCLSSVLNMMSLIDTYSLTVGVRQGLIQVSRVVQQRALLMIDKSVSGICKYNAKVLWGLTVLRAQSVVIEEWF